MGRPPVRSLNNQPYPSPDDHDNFTVWLLPQAQAIQEAE